MGNSYVEKGLVQVAESLKGGVMLSQALEELNLFQPVLISMVAAGEESGALDMVLEDAGSFYEKGGSQGSQPDDCASGASHDSHTCPGGGQCGHGHYDACI